VIKRYILVLTFLCSIILPVISWSALSWGADKIQGNACYTYGDNESLVQAERQTKMLAIRNAIESYSVFIESKTNVKNFEVISDIIDSVSAQQVQNIKILRRDQSGRKICYTVQGYVNPEKMKRAIMNYSSDVNPDVQLQDNGYFRIIKKPFAVWSCHKYERGEKLDTIKKLIDATTFLTDYGDDKLNEIEREKHGFKQEDCLSRSTLVHLQFLKPCIATTISSNTSNEPLRDFGDLFEGNDDAFLPRFRCDYRFKVFITSFSADGNEIKTEGEYTIAKQRTGEKFDKRKLEKSPGETVNHIFSIPVDAKSWKVWVPK